MNKYIETLMVEISEAYISKIKNEIYLELLDKELNPIVFLTIEGVNPKF